MHSAFGEALEICTDLEMPQPLLSFVSFLFTEGQLNQLPVTVLRRGKRYHMLRHVTKVVAAVCVIACPETLYFPSMNT